MKQKLNFSTKGILFLLCLFATNTITYYGSRLLTGDAVFNNLTLPIDSCIPFLPWTVLFYWGCSWIWVVNYYCSAVFSKDGGKRFITAHIMGEAVCLLIFVIFPTAMTRPEITGSTFFDFGVRVTYFLDEPDNLFPSLHCFISWMCWISVRGNKKIPKWYRILSLIVALLICLSTLTVKQHVFVDVPAGILLAELCYLVSGIIYKII